MAEELASLLRSSGWRIFAASGKVSRPARILDMLGTAWWQRNRYQVAMVEVFSGRAWWWAWAVVCLLRLLNKPCVEVLHGGGLPRLADRRPGRVRRLLRSARAVATPSPYMARAMSAYGRTVEVIPNGLHLSRYPFVAVREPRPRLVWLRAFHAMYRPWAAVEVLAHLVPEFPAARLVMLGPDRGDGSLHRTRATARDLGVEHRVQFPGGVPKEYVPWELSQHDIFLNTTTVESFGISMMEAAALGLCIVSTNAGAIPTLWRDGEEVLLVQPEDPAAMAAAVRRVLTEPGLAERLSRTARLKAERFDWHRVFPQWERLLHQAIEGADT